MPDGVVTWLGHDVVNVEGAREMAGHVDSCLRRNDGWGRRHHGRGRRHHGRGSRNDGTNSANDGRDGADADEGAGMTRPMPVLATRP